jgi:hypothetical protein
MPLYAGDRGRVSFMTYLRWTTDVLDAGHFGIDSVAEITWGAVAGNQSRWNRSSATCLQTYCHGNFTGGYGANAPV